MRHLAEETAGEVNVSHTTWHELGSTTLPSLGRGLQVDVSLRPPRVGATVPAMRCWVGVLLLCAGCTTDAATVPLGGVGLSSVILFAEGAFAVDRDADGALVPAIPLDDITAGHVFTLDYAQPLASLAIPSGRLVDDPVGGPLPRPSVVRQLHIVDGDPVWHTVNRGAVDESRTFGGIPRPPAPCPRITVAPIMTSTLAGEPRFLRRAGARHAWLGLAGQPVRAVDVRTGGLSIVAFDGRADVVTAASDTPDAMWTVRSRDGHPVLEHWTLDPLRPGQVLATPRAAAPLPDGDYRWLANAIIDERPEVYALAREGVWVRHDSSGTAEVARWSSEIEESAFGGVAVGKTGDIAAVLSDSSRIRWRNRGESEVRERYNGDDPMVALDYALGGDLVVGVANGSLLWLRGGREWVNIGNRTFVEAVHAIVPLGTSALVTLGVRGSITTWRSDGGWCDPFVVAGGPDLAAWAYGEGDQLLVLARTTDGVVVLYRVDFS
jgi:hypothetical protein